ncbi:hypothetical protein N39L_05430 [Limnospira platensis NIES-39]|nr:hypothetical protein N39L_05430 [Arthrospira platensis NIES-39]
MIPYCWVLGYAALHPTYCLLSCSLSLWERAGERAEHDSLLLGVGLRCASPNLLSTVLLPLPLGEGWGEGIIHYKPIATKADQ